MNPNALRPVSVAPMTPRQVRRILADARLGEPIAARTTGRTPAAPTALAGNTPGPRPASTARRSATR